MTFVYISKENKHIQYLFLDWAIVHVWNMFALFVARSKNHCKLPYM